MDEPVFYYDFNSPFAYIAAHRVDDVLPVRPRWQPIAFAFLLIAHSESRGRSTWRAAGRRCGIASAARPSSGCRRLIRPLA